MAFLSIRADFQSERLARHFAARNRIEAVYRLQRAVSEALVKADNEALRTRAYPSVYRELADLGFRWFKIHRYWFAIVVTPHGNVIAHILDAHSNIPARLRGTRPIR